MKETYSVEIRCHNCRSFEMVEIPKGTTRLQFERERRICKVCGCKLSGRIE